MDNRLLPASKRRLTPYRREYLAIAITEYRRKLKAMAVAYKGGRCTKCGYDKCDIAIDFHHIDPKKKDFSISGHCKSFERIKPELDKTILLCANCHRELHDKLNRKALRLRKQKFSQRSKPLRGGLSHRKH
jgi:predicted HNH restriction endonuclease